MTHEKKAPEKKASVKKEDSRLDLFFERVSDVISPKVKGVMSHRIGKTIASATVIAGSVFVGVKFGLDASAPEQADNLKEGVMEYAKLIVPIGGSALVGATAAFLLTDVDKETKAISMGDSEEKAAKKPAVPTPEVQNPEATQELVSPNPEPTESVVQTQLESTPPVEPS